MGTGLLFKDAPGHGEFFLSCVGFGQFEEILKMITGHWKNAGRGHKVDAGSWMKKLEVLEEWSNFNSLVEFRRIVNAGMSRKTREIFKRII